MKFYEKLVILRKKALLSQEALAEKLDVTRQTVSKWELGQTKPDMDKLSAMSKLFDIDINILTNDEVSLDGIKSDDARVKKEEEKMKPEKKERKFILYIMIIIFVASSVTLIYRVGLSLKDKFDAIKEESNKHINNVNQQIQDVQNKIKEEEAQEEIDSFNRDFETWVGTETEDGASFQIDAVIKNNKKNSSHLIEVVFDGTSYGTDPSSIQSIKNSLSTWTADRHIQYYEVSADYDSNGYINRVTIETR